MDTIFKGKTLLITGGSGTFGRALARKVLAELDPQKVIIFSRDEWKQWEMQQSDPLFRSDKVRYFLGDVRDATRLRRAFSEVHLIVHAAALKQVPAAEYNPSEFVKTNVLGAMNVIDAAIDCGVERVLALSTDKAVNPANLYGATKLCADKLFCAGNAYVGKRGYPRFSVVRYGNVIGSRGSAVTVWQRLVAEGAEQIPITDTQMTRFWITVEQAVSFVIATLAGLRGGEIFVPKCPSLKVVDLAAAIAPNAKLQVTGIRAGEKVHELLISKEEGRRTCDYSTHYVVAPEVAAQSFTNGNVGHDFCYASNTNKEWISAEELATMMRSPIPQYHENWSGRSQSQTSRCAVARTTGSGL